MKKSLLKILSIRNRDYSQYIRSLLLTDSVRFTIRVIVVVCILFNFMNSVQAQTIGVRIPNVSVLVGDTVEVPVYIDSSLTGANVLSYQFQISYNTNVVDPIDVVPGSVNGGFGNPLYGFTSSYVNVANAGTTPLADTGVLFYITFVGKQASYTALNFNGTGNNFLNEGSPAVDLDNGSITVQAQTVLNISPTNPIILNGNQQQFNASSGTSPYSWLSDNPSVATIDNVTGLATGMSIGTTEISATDVNGAVGSTLLEVRGFKLTIRDTSGLTGTTLDLPIYVSDLSGLNVTSGNFTLSYTSSRISFNSIITTGTMLDGYSLPEANQSTNSLNIAFAGSTPLVGSGILMYIRFDLSTVSTGGTTINFQNVVFNEDLLAIVDNGYITNSPLANINISPSTANLVAGETLQFSASGGTGPYSWSTSDSTLATISPTGLLTALKGGVVQVSAEDIFGAVGTSNNITIYDFRVTIPDTASSQPLAICDIPVFMTGLPPGKTINSIQGIIQFESPELDFLQIVNSGTLTDGWSFISRLVSGNSFIFAAAGANSISTAGELFKIRFDLTSDLTINENAYVNINEILFNEGDPIPTTENGSITLLECTLNIADCDDSNCSTLDSLDTKTCSCLNIPIPPPDCDDLDCSTADSYDNLTCACVHTPIPPDSTIINLTSCNPADTGTVVQNLVNGEGCDSIVTTITTLLPSYAVTINTESCNPADTGTIVQNLTNGSGCDSVVTIFTSLIPSYDITINAESCNPADTGTAVQNLIASTGCDSVVTTITTLLPSFNTTINVLTCVPADTGTVVDSFVAINGCDSLITTITELGETNDNCANATALIVGSGCVMDTFSNVCASAESNVVAPNPSCGFYQGGDVWFTALMPLSGNLRIETSSVSGINPQFAVYSGSCNAFTEIKCAQLDNGKTISDPALGGEVIYIRVYNYNSANGGIFTICVYEVPVPPNQDCLTAIELPVNLSCIADTFTNRYSALAPLSSVANPSCGFYKGGNVWFKAVMPLSGELRMSTIGISGINPQSAIYKGVCGSLVEVMCNQLDYDNTIVDTSLAGDTIFIRVWSYNTEEGGEFSICLWDPPVPENDYCENAIALTVNDSCIITDTFTNRYATDNALVVPPNPSCGFYKGGDVWFTAEMPASGNLIIERGQISGTNAQFAAYAGICDALVELGCAQLTSLLQVNDTSLSGQDIYIRVFGYNTEEGGDFTLCVYDTSCLPQTVLINTSICDGDSIQFGALNIQSGGFYSQNFISSEGCDSTVNLLVSILPSHNITLYDSTCIPGNAGVVTDSFTNSFGCDSIITTITTLLPSDTVTINTESCNPADTGTVVQNLTNGFGCDSVVTIITALIPSYDITINAGSCNPVDTGTVVQNLVAQSGCDSIVTTITTLLPSDAVTINAESCNPADTGTVVQNLTNVFGCDSVVTTITALIPSYDITINAESCNPADIGTVVQNLVAQSGCDSIVTTNTTLLPSDAVTINTESCNPADTGTAVQNLTNGFGCDSVVTIITALIPSYDITINAESCNPADTGTVVQNLVAQSGCDSIVTTITTLLPSDAVTINAESCNPADTGTVVQNLTNGFGCDSVVTIITSLIPSYDITINAESCNPADTGTVVQNLVAQSGCDSIVTTITTLLPNDAVTINTESCNPADTGTVVQNLTNGFGCDSVVTIITALIPSYDIIINAESCNPADTGTVLQNLVAQSGCDSIVTTITTLLPNDAVTINTESCNPADTGTVVQNLTNGFGCDSIVTIITTLIPSYDITINAESCNPADTGTVVQNLVAQSGCDSIVTTTITLLPSDAVTINTESCNPADTGTVVQNLTNGFGCDSVVTTITALIPSYDITINAESCNPADTGTVVQNLVAQSGCDSIVTTITTLLPSDDVTINIESCNPADTGTVVQNLTNGFGCDSAVTIITALIPSYDITINAESCNPADTGTVVQNLVAQSGCDSIVTTITTLLPSDAVTINAESCNPADTGTVVQNLTNGFGCDSVVTTITALIPSYDITINAESCNPADTGTVVQNLVAQSGCDSIVTTITALLPNDAVTINAESCNPADTGTVVQNLTNGFGCDSVVTIITALIPSYDITINAESCNPADTGTVVQNLVAQSGCDSIVTTITTLLPSDAVTINAESCNPADTGTIIQNLTNGFGCDSVVTTITILIPSYDITINAESCNPADTGTVIQNFVAQSGCDSIVTTITSLLPRDAVTINTVSCNPADTGTVVQNLTNGFGCDSVVTTITSLISGGSFDTIYQITCKQVNAGVVVNTYPGSNGCDSTVTIVTNFEPLRAKFANSSQGLTTQFINKSTGATQYLWYFGDGQSSTEENPTHTYSNTGLYLVALFAYHPECGIKLKLKIIFVFGGFNRVVDVNQTTDVLENTTFYPNPSNGTVNLKFGTNLPNHQAKINTDQNSDIQLSVINLQGEIVHQEWLMIKDQTIDLSYLPNGLYIFKLTTIDTAKEIRMVIIN